MPLEVIKELPEVASIQMLKPIEVPEMKQIREQEYKKLTLNPLMADFKQADKAFDLHTDYDIQKLAYA
jgi:hypothetical protein